MLLQMMRWIGLLVFALAPGMVAGCASGDAPIDEAAPGDLRQSLFKPSVCECVNSDGKPDKVTCADTCFEKSGFSCGSASTQCYAVCRYDRMTAAPGDECRALDPLDLEYAGRCATKGVSPANLPGCCPGCLTVVSKEEVICAAGNEPKACGRPGEECKLCEDKSKTDCWVPLCKEGACGEQPAPVGQACETAEGASGRCAQKGVCCPGCLSADGTCLKGGEPAACGLGGVNCKVCDYQNACQPEICDSGQCVEGKPLNCDDGNPCTSDSCDAVDGCQYTVNEGQGCNDGNGCTTSDSCNANGSCSGTPVVCDDGNECTQDSCNAGTCEFTPVDNGTTCDDGSSCTESTTCQSGVCSADSSTICHDTTNPCVTSSCGDNGTEACMQVNRADDTPCDDGNPCTTGELCQAGQCSGGGATDCDDNNVCTDDSCDPVDGCTYENTTGECADGDLCTTNDRCQAGACVGDAVECIANNECHRRGECDAASGLCSVLLLPDGTECGEGGECEDGECGGTPTTGGGAGAAGAAGAAGDSGTDGGAGEGPGSGGNGGTAGGSGGSSGSGGTIGGAGVGGSFDGDAYVREPKGCDCRSAPGSAAPSHLAGFGFTGLGLLALFRFKRRQRRAR